MAFSFSDNIVNRFLDWLNIQLWEGWRTVSQTVVNFATSGWTWVVVTVTGFIAITDRVSTFVYGSVVDAFTGGTAMSLSGSPVAGSAVSIFDHLNALMPLQEAFTLINAWSLLMLVGMSYRLIKSWIPSVA